MILCKQCLSPLTKSTQKVFCSVSCSAKYNNHYSPKRHPYEDKFCSCGERKGGRAKTCWACFTKEWKNRTLNTISNSKYNGSLKWEKVRKQARSLMEKWKIPKKCVECGWDLHVEVNHIKKISDFPLNTLVSEVNSKSNLHYLCPNCHWKFEHNKALSSNS